jgi:hypothetical protein
MLTVAPSGSVKLISPRGRPTFSSATRIVTGSVALLLRVTNAISMTSVIRRKNFSGLVRAMNRTIEP